MATFSKFLKNAMTNVSLHGRWRHWGVHCQAIDGKECRSAAKYVTIGCLPDRGGRGIRYSNIDTLSAFQRKTLTRYTIQHLEYLLMKWIDSSYIRAYLSTKNACNWTTFPKSPNERKTSSPLFFSSISFGMNHCLPAHTDKDFGLSIVTVLPHSSVMPQDDILWYFVFPSHGYTIPLKSNDVLIFNPLEYHDTEMKWR